MHRIHASAVFEPPQGTAMALDRDMLMPWYRCDVLERKIGCHILDRLIGGFAVEINRVSQKFPVGLIWRKGLVQFRCGFRTDPIRRATQIGKNAIT